MWNQSSTNHPELSRPALNKDFWGYLEQQHITAQLKVALSIQCTFIWIPHNSNFAFGNLSLPTLPCLDQELIKCL
uniref:Uncharacterized protein n=1 Tax=Bos indicus x Bos taurus TaxID=30522 RepID=A0A4W2BP37_BOBOX